MTSEIYENMCRREGFRAEFRAAWAISIKIWKVELSYPLSVLWFIVMPFMWFIPLMLTGTSVSGGLSSPALEELAGTADWISYISIGMAITGLTISLMWGTGLAFRREQNVGTLETLLSTPVRRDTLVWGAMLHNFQHGGLGVILQLLASVLFFGASINVWGILPALGIVALMVIGLQGVVFTLVCIVLLAKQAWMVIEVVTSTMMLVAPMAYPIAVLHPILQYIAMASPLTYGVESFRNFLMYGFAGPAVIQAIITLIILDVIFVLLGTLMFRRTESYVRSRGALAQF
jgi:ABC-2 type transport system permease protein